MGVAVQAVEEMVRLSRRREQEPAPDARRLAAVAEEPEVAVVVVAAAAVSKSQQPRSEESGESQGSKAVVGVGVGVVQSPEQEEHHPSSLAVAVEAPPRWRAAPAVGTPVPSTRVHDSAKAAVAVGSLSAAARQAEVAGRQTLASQEPDRRSASSVVSAGAEGRL